MKGRKFGRRTPKLFLALLLVLVVTSNGTMGEGRAENLQERFSDVPQLEFEGTTYYLRARVSAILLVGVMEDEATGAPRSDFAAVIAIDDNGKRVTPIYIDPDLLVGDEGERLPLREVYGLGADPDENMRRMVETVNGMLGAELIGGYMGIDLEGISGVEEFGALVGDAHERLHMLRLALENIPSKQLNELYGRVSEYLITDMKSGEVMRAVDKAQRYEVAEALELPTQAAQEGAGGLSLDEAAVRKLVIDAFFSKDLF